MKKRLSGILAFALSFSCANTVFAEDTTEMQEVLLSVKERIVDTSVFDEFNSNLYESYGSKNYSFEWRNSENNQYLSVQADSDGVITYYHYNDRNYYDNTSKPDMNKMSTDEAMKKAQELLTDLNPDISDELVIFKTTEVENLFSDTYSFLVKRVIDEIPVYENTGRLVVNKDATQIKSFSINYTDGLNFIGTDSILSIDSAWDRYFEELGLELQYLTEYKEDGNRSAYLAYVPKSDDTQYIDAVTGEVMNVGNSYKFMANATADMAAESSMGAGRVELTKVEQDELEIIQGLITKQEAERVVRSFSVLGLDEKTELSHINLYKGYNLQDYFYNLNFASEKEEYYFSGSATVNAKTGELTSWYSYTQDNSQLVDVDEEEIKETQAVALKELASLYVGEDAIYDYRNEQSENNNILTYTRYVNDIKYPDNQLHIGIDKKTNRVDSFNVNCSEIEFENPDGIISLEDANKAFSEQVKFELLYIPLISDNKYSGEVTLGYKLLDVYNAKIDAFTGERILPEYDEIKKPLVYSDISKHYAKEQIEALAKFGIGFDEEEFKPDELITQGEFVSLLMSAVVNRYSLALKNGEYNEMLYNDAKYAGIIKDGDNPDGSLSREKSAIFIIRALGLEEVAKLKGIYKTPFSDVTDNSGYIAILYGMGVFNGDENKHFNPHNNLTRAECAVVLYNYLTRN